MRRHVHVSSREIFQNSVRNHARRIIRLRANTMSTALEVLGMTLPYSSGIPAAYPGSPYFLKSRPCISPPSAVAEKVQECHRAAKYLKNLLELDLKPR